MGRGVDVNLRPPRAVCHNTPHIGDGAVRDIDNHRASFAALPDAAALQIARVDHPRVLRNDFIRMDVAKRPIIVAARGEIGDAAGRVVLVA